MEALADASTLVKTETEAEAKIYKLKGKRKKKNKAKDAAIALACRLRSNLEVCKRFDAHCMSAYDASRWSRPEFVACVRRACQRKNQS